MDRHKKKELGEYINKAYDRLMESESLLKSGTAIHESLHEILNALYLIRSEFKDDK
jgi:hypothetical protein